MQTKGVTALARRDDDTYPIRTTSHARIGQRALSEGVKATVRYGQRSLSKGAKATARTGNVSCLPERELSKLKIVGNASERCRTDD